MKRYLALVVLTLLTGVVHAADYPRNQSLYVTMRDGVRIAIDVWLPEDLRTRLSVGFWSCSKGSSTPRNASRKNSTEPIKISSMARRSPH